MMIKDLFKTNESFSLASVKGRTNLYCLLLLHHFGKKMLRDLLDLMETEDVASNGLAYVNAMNVLFPNSVEELNVRLKFLWCAATPLHTVAFEGQKRQTCQIWNEMGIKMAFGPRINSFFELPKQKLLLHRPTPNNERSSEFFGNLRKIDEMFFSRAEAEARHHYYCCNHTCPGMTEQLTLMVENLSTKLARQNTDVQEKYINSHICQIVNSVGGRPNLLNSVIAPDEAYEFPYEKTVILQNAFIRRLFMEDFARLAKRDKAIEGLFAGYLEGTKEFLGKWMRGEYSNDVYLKPDAAGKITMKSDLILDHYEKDFLDTLQEREKDKNYFRISRFDDLIGYATKGLKVPGYLNEDEAGDPDKSTFYFASWLANHKVVGHVTIFAKKFQPNWRPRAYHILAVTFAHSCFNKKTCKAFHDMVLNNGKKDSERYYGRYVHEVQIRDDVVEPPHHAVSNI